MTTQNSDIICVVCRKKLAATHLAEHIQSDPVNHYNVLVKQIETLQIQLQRWAETCALLQQPRPDSLASAPDLSPRSPNPRFNTDTSMLGTIVQNQ